MVPSAWAVLRLMTNSHCPELLPGQIPRLGLLLLQIAIHCVWEMWAGGSRHRHGSKAVLLLAHAAPRPYVCVSISIIVSCPS